MLDILNGVPAILVGIFIYGLLVVGHGQSGFYGAFAVAVTASVQLVGVYLVFASLIVPALAASLIWQPIAMRWRGLAVLTNKPGDLSRTILQGLAVNPFQMFSARALTGLGQSKSQRSWWTDWKCHSRRPVRASMAIRQSENKFMPMRSTP